METYMKKLIAILEAVSKNQEVPKMKIETSELFEMQELLLDFTNLISYQDNDIFKRNRVIKNAIDHGMFLDETYYEGTLQYENLLAKYRSLRTLQDGETHEIIDGNLTEFCMNDVYMVFTKQGNAIKKHLQLAPFYNAKLAHMPAYNFDKLKNVPGTEQEGNYLFVDSQGYFDKSTCFLDDGKLAVLGYDIRKNPFSKKHFRVFDENGEIKDIRSLDYSRLIRKIRDAEAHHQVYTYYNGRPYGGKVVPMGGGYAVLMSNRWHEFLIRMSLVPEDIMKNDFEILCVPHNQKPIKSDQECIDRIENIRKINVKTKEPISSVYAFDMLNKIVENYEFVGTKNKTLEQYVEEQVAKKLGECRCTITPLQNMHLIKGRLVGDNSFYNISSNEKETAIEQVRFIKHLVDNVFDRDYTSKECMTESGKIKPISVNLQDLCIYLNYELPRLQNLAGALKGAKWKKETAPHAGLEKQLALPILCAYKNLIRNNFIDDVADFASVPVGYALAGKQAQNKRMISILDMSMFEIYKQNHKGEVNSAQTFDQKARVLRSLRNAIAHNNISVQFSRNYDLAESKFVFEYSDYSMVRVNIAKFYEFINQPIFSDYASMDKYTIKATNAEELKQFIKKLCEHEKRSGYGHEFSGE